MQEAARQQRNKDLLAELFPIFGRRVEAIISELEASGLRPRIQDAWRPPEAQLEAFNSGHSKLKYGFHNVTGANGEKEALAVDLLDDDNPLASSRPYLLRLAAAARREGLVSGIRWGLPPSLRAAVDQAIDAKDWNANVKLGWDPTHLQPTGITVSQAKAGQRPD